MQGIICVKACILWSTRVKLKASICITILYAQVSKRGQLLPVNTNNIIILQSVVDSYSYNLYQGRGQGLLRQTYRRLKLFSDGRQRSARFSQRLVFVFHHSDDIRSRIRHLWSFLLFLLCFLGQIEQILKLVGFSSVWIFLTLNIDTTLNKAGECYIHVHMMIYCRKTQQPRHGRQGVYVYRVTKDKRKSWA